MSTSQRAILLVLATLFLGWGVPIAGTGGTLRFVVMAAKNPVEEGAKHKALSNYVSARIPEIHEIQIKTARDYRHAAELFRSGDVDGMFAGSFVAAVLIRQGLALPLVQPFSRNDLSLYRALVVAKKGQPPFQGLADLEGKRVAYCALASAGQIYAMTLIPGGSIPSDYFTEILCASHQKALRALSQDEADYAIVKDMVWNPVEYPELVVVGGDTAKHPNNTLILAPWIMEKYGESIARVLLNLEYDQDLAAIKVKEKFRIRGFLQTDEEDFRHTFRNIEKAGIQVDSFDFSIL